MKTPQLKALTGACIGLGLAGMLALAFFVANRPTNPTAAERRAYVVRNLAAASVMLVMVSVAGVGSFVLVRRAREEYRQASLTNLRTLIEGTRDDQRRKAGSEVDAEP